MSTRSNPVALIVEDDRNTNKTIALVLQQLGISPICVYTFDEALNQIAVIRPEIVLVDLNLGALCDGFMVIRAIRERLGSEIPIIVISGRSDSQSVVHALEEGADDFIIKPIEKKVLTSKLSRHVITEELLKVPSRLFPVPSQGSPAEIEVSCEIREVDEFGIKLYSKHIFNKGASFQLEGKCIEEMSGSLKPIRLRVISSQFDSDEKLYSLFVEYEAQDEALLGNIRKWITKNAN